MKTKYKIIVSLIILLLALTFNSKVKAASASLSVSSTSVTVGTKVTVTTTIKGAAWDLELKGAVVANYADSTADAEDTTKKEKTSFTPKKAGKYTVTLTGNVTGSNDRASTPISVSKTITVKDKSTNNNTTSDTDDNTTNDANNNALLKDATLKNLGIKPNDFSGFRKATTSYSVSVPKNVEKISIYATPTNPKATVSGTGTKSLQIGKNTFNVKVVAEDKKTTKTYTLTITRKNEDENASDATLTNLGIRPKEYDFTGFKTGTTSYNVSVPNDVEKITIYATAKSDKATISGIGSKTLNVGANKCEVKVTSQDKKTTKIYTINVTRKEKVEEEEKEEKDDEKEEEEDNNIATENEKEEGLKNIEIKGYNLSPAFSKDVYSYKIDVTEDLQKLDIIPETTSDNIEVEVAGNENLKSGENIITLIVQNKKDNTIETYQINANIGNQKAATETKDEKSSFIKKEWIIMGAILVIVVILILFLVKRLRNNEDDEEDEDEEDEYEELYEDDDEYEQPNSSSDDLRKIGLFDQTNKIEFDEPIDEKPRNHGKHKGKRFK